MRVLLTLPANDIDDIAAIAAQHGWEVRIPQPTGRPHVLDRLGFEEAWLEIAPQVRAGRLAQREAARRLGVSPASVRRLLSGG